MVNKYPEINKSEYKTGVVHNTDWLKDFTEHIPDYFITNGNVDAYKKIKNAYLKNRKNKNNLKLNKYLYQDELFWYYIQDSKQPYYKSHYCRLHTPAKYDRKFFLLLLVLYRNMHKYDLIFLALPYQTFKLLILLSNCPTETCG